MLTLPAIVEEILGQASRRPQAVALEEVSGHQITYERLARDVDAVTSGLLQRGLRPGESVLFTVPPSIASITLILSLVRVGATIVAADPRMGAAVFASRLLGTMLFNVKPGDPAVVAGIALMLAGAAIAASLVPGARATRVDPITVLKVE